MLDLDELLANLERQERTTDRFHNHLNPISSTEHVTDIFHLRMMIRNQLSARNGFFRSAGHLELAWRFRFRHELPVSAAEEQ
jgi:hypothetical protein